MDRMTPDTSVKNSKDKPSRASTRGKETAEEKAAEAAAVAQGKEEEAQRLAAEAAAQKAAVPESEKVVPDDVEMADEEGMVSEVVAESRPNEMTGGSEVRPPRAEQILQFQAGKNTGSFPQGSVVEGFAPAQIPAEWVAMDGQEYFLTSKDWGPYFGRERERVTTENWTSQALKHEWAVRQRAGFVEIVMQIGEMDKAEFSDAGCRKGLMERYNLDFVGSMPPRK